MQRQTLSVQVIARLSGMLCFGLALALLAAAPAAGQGFGQNKVQYRRLKWSELKTKHFRLYFHNGEREAAIDAGRMAERAYDRLSILLDHRIEKPIPVILYASQSEFQQTNVTPSMVGEGTGGFTEYVKRRVTVPLTGSYRDFDHVLTHELVHAFQIDILTGGGERGGAGLMRYMPPLWFMEGMAEYFSLAEVDPQTQMWLRDGALQGYLIPVTVLDQVEDIRVYRYGQAILAYLGATYGDRVIGEILKKLPGTRSLDRAMVEVVGQSLRKFSEDWTEAMRRQYLPEIREHQKPEEFAFRLTEADRDLSDMNLAPAVSPDGTMMAYFSDRSLYNDLYVASALDGRARHRMVKGERKADFESLRFYTSSIDCAPRGDRIVFVALAEGRDVLQIQSVHDRKLLGRIQTGCDAMTSPSWSPDGEWIVFSGMVGGRTNLYRIRSDGTGLEQLTDSRFEAQDPRFSPDGRSILFVSDRGPGTDFDNLLFSLPELAVLDLETRTVTVLPRQAGRNISPQWFPDGRHVLFISDRSGIANLYIRDLDTHEDRRITDVLTGIGGVTPTSPGLSLSRNGRRLVFSAFSRGTWDLFAIKDPLDLWEKGRPWNGPFDSDTVRALAVADSVSRGAVAQVATMEGPQAAVQAAEITAAEPAESLLTPGVHVVSVTSDSAAAALLAGSAAVPPSAVFPDSGAVPGQSALRPRIRRHSSRLDSLMTARVESIGGASRDWKLPVAPRIGLSSDSARAAVDVADVFARERRLPDPSSFEIEPYKAHFTADYAAAAGFFASNVGVAAQSELQFSDILGDQMFVVGADVYGSISDSDLLLEYINLKRRVNWGISLFQFRNDYYIFAAETSDQFVSQMYRGAEFMVQRPFNRFSRVEWSLDGMAVSSEVVEESFDLLGETLTTTRTGQGTYRYLAPGMALVHDNTIYGSTGPIGGGRSRLEGQVAIGDLSFRSYIGDFRRYVNLRHRYALAGRVIGALSQGRDPQYFRIGGPYTLRGYPFGEFRGTKVAVANLEFRFPLVEELALGFPLPLMLQGVRGALFFDTGAAWDDNHFLQLVASTDGGRHLKDLKASYGLSTSMNIGFTVLKWDLAWRTDLRRNLGPAIGYLSFGLDF